MMSQDWGDAGTQEFGGTRMNGWQQYYGAAGYMAPADPAEWTDEILATHLGVEPRDLADAVQRSRRATARRIRRCPLCDSPRYGSGCRCDDLAYGIIYD